MYLLHVDSEFLLLFFYINALVHQYKGNVQMIRNAICKEWIFINFFYKYHAIKNQKYKKNLLQ